jgi:hypothetical protein
VIASIVSGIVRSIAFGVIKGDAGGAAVEEPAEFITNGNFAGGATNWTQPAGGWTITALATNTTSGNARKLVQNFGALVQPLVSGHNYILSFDCDNTAGVTMFNVWVDSGGFTELMYSDMPVTGTITVPFTAVDNATTIAFASGTAEPTGLTIDNVSLVPA